MGLWRRLFKVQPESPWRSSRHFDQWNGFSGFHSSALDLLVSFTPHLGKADKRFPHLFPAIVWISHEKSSNIKGENESRWNLQKQLIGNIRSRGSLLNVIWVNHAPGGAVIKIYSFHITKCPRMIIVVLPVSGNNYLLHSRGGVSSSLGNAKKYR